jgi:adenylyltransferase/sulfurtransferase
MRASLNLEFSDDEVQRYARHILLDEVGGVGQAKLRNARVLVVGAGGLGSPLILYLAAAGVGTLGIADGDVVELSNLQRQVAHTMGWLGQSKARSAAAAALAINPDVCVIIHDMMVSAQNVAELIASYDIVCDGTDNFASRFLLADACHHGRRPLISAAVLRFEGQLSNFRSGVDPGQPCYRCLYPDAPPVGLVPTCAEAGVLGAVTGVMGTLQATEVIKEILGIGDSLAGRLLLWDGLAMRFRVIGLQRDPACPLCGVRVAAMEGDQTDSAIEDQAGMQV